MKRGLFPDMPVHLEKGSRGARGISADIPGVQIGKFGKRPGGYHVPSGGQFPIQLMPTLQPFHGGPIVSGGFGRCEFLHEGFRTLQDIGANCCERFGIARNPKCLSSLTNTVTRFPELHGFDYILRALYRQCGDFPISVREVA